MKLGIKNRADERHYIYPDIEEAESPLYKSIIEEAESQIYKSITEEAESPLYKSTIEHNNRA